MESLVVKAMLQSKLVMNVEILDVNPQQKVVQKSLVVDSSPKLTNNDWIREQFEGPNISSIIQLLKFEKLKSYFAKELGSSGLSVLLKYRKDLIMRNGLLYRKVLLKNHPEPILQFVLLQDCVCKVILACHDDNGHLGTERILGFYKRDSFGPKWRMMCISIYVYVIDEPGSSKLRKELECNQYWSLIP